jgi:hypothetical protein
MITKKVTLIRPSDDVNFYEFDLNFITYRKTNYLDTKKIQSVHEMDETGLKKTVTITFFDDATKDQYENDPIIKEQVKKRNQHNKTFGIKKEVYTKITG